MTSKNYIIPNVKFPNHLHNYIETFGLTNFGLLVEGSDVQINFLMDLNVYQIETLDTAIQNYLTPDTMLETIRTESITVTMNSVTSPVSFTTFGTRYLVPQEPDIIVSELVLVMNIIGQGTLKIYDSIYNNTLCTRSISDLSGMSIIKIPLSLSVNNETLLELQFTGTGTLNVKSGHIVYSRVIS